MTASAMESERVHCLEVGMTDFLIKPFSSENLFKIINSHLRKNRPMGPRSKSMPSENATAVKSESPLFDISCMDEIVQGDDAFREELISLFIRNIPKDLIKLKEAWERKDYSAVGAIAHKMTPSLEMMGVSSLKNIIIELKNSTFSEQNLESIPQWISIVDDMCCKVVRELKQTWHLPEKEDS
jgi:CheY-like chemotaxis protein